MNALPFPAKRAPWRRWARLTLLTIAAAVVQQAHAAKLGDVEVVAELPIRPGNVTAAPSGRVFATVHPLGAPADAQLIEVTGPNSYKPWPSAEVQRGTRAASDDRIDTPLGVALDDRGRLWIVDMGLNLGKTRIWGFDVAQGKRTHLIELPQDIAPKGSFVQDLVVDERNGWIYLADIANPGLIAVEISTGKARRFSGHPSLLAEPEATMVIGGKAIQFQGKPARVGVNPISLSTDDETLFFGAMNGRTWYSVPAKLLREGASDARIGEAIRRVGAKPVSDGAATDGRGRHFFTNLNEGGIDQMNPDGRLAPLVRDPRMDWPDSVQVGKSPWLYVSVNQLHKTPAFTGGADEGKPPYLVMRVYVGETSR
ncbi:L-dopachrome tautomerase-related protein [Roseateles sp.]|uniref:L-dopachrome tautomerase-related protein n=1 Tax=Roseateles sp. TaxID=1971397 RepID=UPI0031CE4F03